MLLLSRIHYVIRPGVCRDAWIDGDGSALDTVDLGVQLEWWDSRGLMHEAPLWRDVAGAEYDRKGAVGTWHTEHECMNAGGREER